MKTNIDIIVNIIGNINTISRAASRLLTSPSNLTLTIDTSYQITLDWTNTLSNYDSVEIYRSDNGGSYVLIDSVAKYTSIYSDCGLDSGYYSYKIRYRRGVRYSSYTSAVSCTLGSELLTTWTNGVTYPYETFTSSGTEITSAINTTSLGSCKSDTISVTLAETYIVEFDLTINSGVAPRFAFYGNPDALGSTASLLTIATSGHNLHTITITATHANAAFVLRTLLSGDAQNWSAANFTIKKVS